MYSVPQAACLYRIYKPTACGRACFYLAGVFWAKSVEHASRLFPLACGSRKQAKYMFY